MPWVNESVCIGCGVCVEECPVDAIALTDGIAVINDADCIRCGTCHDVCPEEAVRHDSERISPQMGNQAFLDRLPSDLPRLFYRPIAHQPRHQTDPPVAELSLAHKTRLAHPIVRQRRAIEPGLLGATHPGRMEQYMPYVSAVGQCAVNIEKGCARI